MLIRKNSFLDFFVHDDSQRLLVHRFATHAADRANGMIHYKDYQALASIALHHKPRLILEIGTYLGVTSDFFLELLPECKVVSIAYLNPFWNIFRRFNNTDLAKEQVGSCVGESRRSRFTQLYGDSHKLVPSKLVDRYGSFDLVFIDGDHSRKGVRQDTALAKEITGGSGAICWHDANPKQKYMDVRIFLEQELRLTAVATIDDYIGGIACWSVNIEKILVSESK